MWRRISYVDKAKYAVETNLSQKLQARLAINAKASAVDFQQWVQDKVKVRQGDNVLDVGCGTGAQSLRFLDRVGAGGSVFAVDAMATSIEHLRKAAEGRNLTAEVADMMDLGAMIGNRKFDVAACTYAIYYAKEPSAVLQTMYDALNPGGRLMVCVPSGPHGLVELVRNYAPIPAVVDESLQIGRSLLDPFVSERFDGYSVSHLRNEQTLPDIATVMQSLENAAYFDPSSRSEIEAEAGRRIAAEGAFRFYKRSFLIVGEIRGAK
jgi:ubiquinone/menaquinone biosynthesis C-methylase UbiE